MMKNGMDYAEYLSYIEGYVSYIEEYALNYMPEAVDEIEGQYDKECDIWKPSFFETTVHVSFYRSCEEGKISIPVDKNKYDKNTIIKELINDLGLDPTQLWYFILFVYNKINGRKVETIETAETALEYLAKDILDNISKEDEKGNPEFKKTASITLQIGSKKTIIDKKYAIAKIAHLITPFLAESRKEMYAHPTNSNSRFNTYAIPSHDLTLKIIDEPITMKAAHFAKMFIQLFDMQESIKSKRRKGASISEKEKELISNILYLVKIVETPAITQSTDYLDSILKRYQSKRYINKITDFS